MDKKRKYLLSEEERKKCVEVIKEINKEKRNFTSPRIFINPELSVNNPQSIEFCRALRGLQQLSIDYNGGMLFCGKIYKKCKNKPMIEKEGVVNALCRNIDLLAEIKKQRLKDISQGIYFEGFDTCQYCNKYIEKILKKYA